MDSAGDVHTIHHVESLRRKASYYWPHRQYHFFQRSTNFHDQCFKFRPALNLRPLIASLSPDGHVIATECGEDISADDEPSASGVLRKRKRPGPTLGPSKRIRLDSDVQGSSNCEQKTIQGKELARGGQIYPSYWASHHEEMNETYQTVHTSFLQAYQFEVCLRYNKVVDHSSEHYVDEKALVEWGWLEEEVKLASLIEAYQNDASLPRDIDLGKFFLVRYDDHLLAISAKGRNPTQSLFSHAVERSEKWLCLLPDIRWPDALSKDDLNEQCMQPVAIHRDFITACTVFQSHHRSKLEANLHMRVLPKGTYPEHDLPFELRARFTLSLAIPELYRPFLNAPSQSKTNELEGLQRRLICLFTKTPLTRPVYSNAIEDSGDVTIPYFLKTLCPAPPLAQYVTYESLQPDGLLPTLMPFQRRTVAWMLEREGKRITQAGAVVPLDESTPSSSSQMRQLPVFWEEITLGDQKLFFNRLTSAVSPTLPEVHPALGGILAEEPGLGKTMECISLVLLNPASERNPTNQRWDSKAELHIKEIKTTLIVTPPALAGQWADEISTHAPDLKVFVYEGWAKLRVPITEAEAETERAKRQGLESKKSRSKRSSPANNAMQNGNGVQHNDVDPVLDWSNYINQFDVCITTYDVLRADMFIAHAPRQRPRRQGTEYMQLKQPRSPLIMCEWYRVIMDEVQMGTGRSIEMVSLIPRLSSFAVSGTPARSRVSDLISVLRFLRIDDLVAPTRMWNRLLTSGFKDLFVSLFQRYCVRTLKSSIKNELTIPQQQRYLVGIELGRVERHVYDQALEESLAELGLDARGVAQYNGWEVNASVLRNALRRLRGICTHPQVGQLTKQADKSNKTSMSMADVLDSMRDQNWRNLADDRKAKVLTLTRLAQLQQHWSDNPHRYQRALEHLLTAEKEVNQLVDEIKALIAEHNVKGDVLKKEAQALRNLRKINRPGDRRKGSEKGKEKEFERNSKSLDDHDSDSDDSGDDEDQGLPKTSAGEDHRVKRMALQARLRECLIVLHRVKFLQGDTFHVLGPSYSEREDAAYAEAENLRRDLLKSTEEAANRAMQRLSTAATEKRVTEQTLLIPSPFMKGGGIKSAILFEEANEIIEDILNEQSALLWQWRTKIVELLTQKLNAVGDQADGEEYTRTLDTQGEAEVYLQAYATLLADRRETIAAERTLLAAHEGRERKTRGTKVAARAQENLKVPEDVDVQPQHEVLYQQLLEGRKELQMTERALKSVMVDLSAIAVRTAKENDPEKVIAKDGAARLRALIANLLEVTDKLDADIALLRKVFNDRIVYFRQLQEISDTVTEVQWEGALEYAVEACQRENADFEAKINTSRARQRYLEHLASDESGVSDADTVCILCQCEFLRGFITQCAHIFCEECMKAWIARGQGRACPVCRSLIDPTQLQRFAIQDDQRPPPMPVVKNGELIPVSRREIQYNMIDPVLFADIQTMESSGSYGSKIQTLIRHLLHIQLVDPGAKSIVFSAWADSLTIIEHALHFNGISCLRLDKHPGKGKGSAAKRFRTEPDLEVLLLHGERDNAGLNITCASRVFLLESVVNHGFEVQAIARIDRMGQTQATEVFCYYAEETVEKNILDLAARQGLSLYTLDNSAGLLNVTSFVTDSEKNLVDSPAKSGKKGQSAQKGDFIFKVDDMLAILFPHMFEDVEFLLPPEARTEEAPTLANGDPGPVLPPIRRRQQQQHVNAEAGPSRLPVS